MHSVFASFACTNKEGRRGAPICLNRSQPKFADGTNAATDLSQFRKAQFDNFLFLFNGLLEHLVHYFLRPLRSLY